MPAEPAEAAAENIGENILEAAEPGTAAEAAKALTVHAGMAELIIVAALFVVAEHLVGFVGLLEFFFRLFIALIAVRVIF